MGFFCVGDTHVRRSLELTAGMTLHVPPLCMATIPHDPVIESIWHDFILLRVPHHEAFSKRNLIVEQGEVKEGALTTTVFNLSKKPVKIAMGDPLGRLIALPLR